VIDEAEPEASGGTFQQCGFSDRHALCGSGLLHGDPRSILAGIDRDAKWVYALSQVAVADRIGHYLGEGETHVVHPILELLKA
jgi:hypothetical protein